MNEDAVIEKPKFNKKIDVKIETKKQKCFIVDRLENTTNILFNNMVYNIDNSKIKECGGKSVLVEYVVKNGIIEFV